MKHRNSNLATSHKLIRLFNFTIAAPLIFSLVGCNGETVEVNDSASAQSNSTQGNSADFDAEVYGHTSWSVLSPFEESRNEPTGEVNNSDEVVGDEAYSCTVESYSMTDTPKEFVAIEPDKPVMWLGNLIQGDSHLKVGSLQELSIREREPLKISIDLLRSDNYRVVENPSLTSVESAIGELVGEAVAAGHEAAADAYYESKEAHSTEQTSLELGFSAEYLGASAETSLSVDKKADQKSFFAYFVQNAFTVSIELPTAPHDLVSDEFTQAQLDDLKGRGKISENNPPLYISSMTYGRVLIYKITSTHSESRIKAAISASYNGISGSANGHTEQEIRETLTESEIEISAFGGNQSNIERMIRSGDLGDYFHDDTRLTSMEPISFEVRNLKDNTIAEITRTDEYSVKKCLHTGKAIPAIGEKMTVYFDSATIPSDCDGGINKGDIYGRFDVISTNATGGEITTRVSTVQETQVQSGNTLNIASRSVNGNSATVIKYYGETFRISGQLKDADGGARGADDIVGNWNANQFDISKKQPGTHYQTAVSNCSGNNPRLTYRIARDSYVYYRE